MQCTCVKNSYCVRLLISSAPHATLFCAATIALTLNYFVGFPLSTRSKRREVLVSRKTALVQSSEERAERKLMLESHRTALPRLCFSPPHVSISRTHSVCLSLARYLVQMATVVHVAHHTDVVSVLRAPAHIPICAATSRNVCVLRCNAPSQTGNKVIVHFDSS